MSSSPDLRHAQDQSGRVIDRYRVVEQIGEGGVGTLWLAQQPEPARRQVALNVIKLGMDTYEVVLRFEAERQALALMDPPASQEFSTGVRLPAADPSS